MRFALVAFSAAALAALSGCNNSPPPAPDSAWNVNMSSAGGTCNLAVSQKSLGDITDAMIVTRVTDGIDGVSVSCSVSGTGPFAVTANASQGVDSLQINIPSLSATATQASPSLGVVSYESDATVVPFTGTSCNFYFLNKDEGVAAGKMWAAFDCPQLVNGQASPPETCSLVQSFVAFENCETVASM